MIKNYKDNWKQVKDSALITINKNSNKYPSDDWKVKILISEHSPIRKLKFTWIWEKIKYWVSVHFVRHKIGIDHFIRTQRSDRTGIIRDEIGQGAEVEHEIDINAQAIINISKVRLCYQASTETRQKWQEFITELEKIEPELALVCVPSCIYRMGCPEFKKCGFFKKFIDWCKEKDVFIFDIKNRYILYKEFKEVNK